MQETLTFLSTYSQESSYQSILRSELQGLDKFPVLTSSLQTTLLIAEA